MPKPVHWAIACAVVLLASVLYWAEFAPLWRVELAFRDAHFHWRGPLKPGPEAVIAAIDEKSLDRFGRWPWPRPVLARLVDRLTEAGAVVIGFDMVFSAPEHGLRELEKFKGALESAGADPGWTDRAFDFIDREWSPDRRFAESLERSGKVALGFFAHHLREEVAGLDPSQLRESARNILPGRFKGFLKKDVGIDLGKIRFRSIYGVESNISLFSEKVGDAGFLSFDVDPDGAIRRLPLIVGLENPERHSVDYYPPLSIRALERLLDGALIVKVNASGVESVILDGERSIEIPTGPDGVMEVNYLGGQGTFPYYSIADILDGSKMIPDGAFKGKVVLVGAVAKGLKDIRPTPFDPVFPGVEIHATVIDNILSGRMMESPPWLPLGNTAGFIVLGLALALAYSRISPGASVVVAVAVSAGLFALAQWVFAHHRLWLSDIYPQMENGLIWAGITVHRFIGEEKQRRFIKTVFGQYVSPAVIEKLLKNPETLKLGGEERELTAFFTDIADFSKIAEGMTPTDFVSHLNHYLSEMTDILMKHDGTLDKYDGDAIKVFFGAPVFFEDHARRACQVGIEMQERLAELRDQWKREGKPEMHMRIGINTGPILVGNFGSSRRMNYGMNGDAVNLAARLEGVNKIYGTSSLISGSTYAAAREFIEARELDLVQVVGRREPVAIFELLGKKGCLNETDADAFALFAEGLGLYRNREWEGALERFEEVLRKMPGDGPSRVFIERCRSFRQDPPGADWNGVFTMTRK